MISNLTLAVQQQPAERQVGGVPERWEVPRHCEWGALPGGGSALQVALCLPGLVNPGPAWNRKPSARIKGERDSG